MLKATVLIHHMPFLTQSINLVNGQSFIPVEAECDILKKFKRSQLYFLVC